MSAADIDIKINEVHQKASDFSKEDIIIVLQQNDMDVAKTISDFADGKATSLLEQWKTSSKSAKAKNKRKKNKGNKGKDDKKVENVVMNGVSSAAGSDTKPSIDGAIATDDQLMDPRAASVALKHMLTDQVPKKTKPNDTNSKKAELPLQKEIVNHSLSRFSEASRARTTSESSSKSRQRRRQLSEKQNPNFVDSSQASINATNNVKHMEKAVKELQRFTVSFDRSKNLLTEEFEESYKSIKLVFEELTDVIMNREVQLIRMLDIRKEEAFSMLGKREAKAKDLKRRTDRVASMNPAQMQELRQDVKNFVSDRKFDEDLGKGIRFTYEREVVDSLPNFGELAAVKNINLRNRIRYESTASDVSSIPSLADTHSYQNDVNPALPSATAATNLDMSLPSQPTSSNWADAVDTHPLSDSRAPWALDTPLAVNQSDQGKMEKKRSPKAKKNRKKGSQNNPGVDKEPEKKSFGQASNSIATSQGESGSKPLSHRDSGFRPQSSGDTGSKQSNVRQENFRNRKVNPSDGARQEHRRDGDPGREGDPANSQSNRYRSFPRGRGGYRGGGYRGGYRSRPDDNFRNSHYDAKDQRSTPLQDSTGSAPLPPRSNPGGRRRFADSNPQQDNRKNFSREGHRQQSNPANNPKDSGKGE